MYALILNICLKSFLLIVVLHELDVAVCVIVYCYYS